jgi:uncharacterized membrane protein YraQ (UPF0718 family)
MNQRKETMERTTADKSGMSPRKPLYTPTDLVFPALVLVITAVMLAFNPDRTWNVAAYSWEFFVEIVTILPAVVILMGLFAVFVPTRTVVRYLGAGVGARGFFLALALGTLPTGPLYVAFPLVKTLRRKGAGTANLVAFITAWACIKLPQEIVELRFLGWQFTLTRLLLTIGAAAIMGFATDRILRRWERENQAPPLTQTS